MYGDPKINKFFQTQQIAFGSAACKKGIFRRPVFHGFQCRRKKKQGRDADTATCEDNPFQPLFHDKPTAQGTQYVNPVSRAAFRHLFGTRPDNLIEDLKT